MSLSALKAMSPTLEALGSTSATRNAPFADASLNEMAVAAEAGRAASVLSGGASRHPATIREGIHLWEPPVRFAGGGYERDHIEHEGGPRTPLRISAESLRTEP